jgi:hypothetical protein
VQSLAVNGYVSGDVLTALRGVQGRREWQFRYELMSSLNVKVSDLTNVLSGSVAHDYEAEIKRTGKVTVKDTGTINFMSQRIKPWARILMPNGGWAEWPLGVFLLTTPSRKIDISGANTRDIDAYDATIVLQEDTVTSRYYVSAGYVVTTAINEILTATVGINAINIVTSALTTPKAMDWDPGTSKFQIVNALLDLINYNSIWFDGNGTAQVTPYVDPDSTSSMFDYLDNDVSLILPDASETLDLYKVPNRFVGIVSNPDVGQPVLTSTYTNTSVTSPISTVNRGRTITDVKNDEVAVNQYVLDAKTQARAVAAASIYDVVEWQSGLMPFHENGDVYNFTYTKAALSGKYKEVSWGFDLVQGASMTHKCRKTVTLS